jgi:hypothetical protein
LARSGSLGQVLIFNDPVYCDGQTHFRLFFFSVWQPEIHKNIA